MALTEKEIVSRLTESPVMSDAFEGAVKEYLRRMAEDGNTKVEHLGLGFGAQEVLFARFNGSSNDLVELTKRFGPCKVLDLFWFAIEHAVAGESSEDIPVPEQVIAYLRISLRSCPEVYEHARDRARAVTKDLAIFHRLFAVHSRQRTADAIWRAQLQ